MSDSERNSIEILNSWHFDNEFKIWRFICFLSLGIETTDADIWLTDIINQNLKKPI